ncbi:hypothetical protein Pan216_08530 [Planctomycetes bacterium Pan216]|uniref:Uncharacterized protein n=1 Tax=Kolteria novifilia TaxID=2527975 RepID=A0A518AZ75_9BACT|nr:hypothetical protein Pan216_08530 [Planctomycetes bacterium Pan216]
MLTLPLLLSLVAADPDFQLIDLPAELGNVKRDVAANKVAITNLIDRLNTLEERCSCGEETIPKVLTLGDNNKSVILAPRCKGPSCRPRAIVGPDPPADVVAEQGSTAAPSRNRKFHSADSPTLSSEAIVLPSERIIRTVSPVDDCRRGRCRLIKRFSKWRRCR